MAYSLSSTRVHSVIILANQVAPWVMKESIYGQNIDTQSGNSANAPPLLATYGAHSSESSLFYHHTLDCFGCVLFHLSKYWTASLRLRAAHMSSRVPSLLPVFGPITFSSLLPPSERAQDFLFLIRILRDQLLLMDSFSSGQCQCVSLFPTRSPTEMPKIWAHGLAFKLLKSRQAKFSAYFHVIVMHINTYEVLAREDCRWFESITKYKGFKISHVWATCY